MRCREVRHWLVEFAADGIDPAREAEFHAHLAACPRCAREWREIEQVGRLLAAVERPAPSEARMTGLSRRIRESLTAERPAPGPWFRPAAAGALACLFVGVIIAVRPPEAPPETAVVATRAVPEPAPATEPAPVTAAPVSPPVAAPPSPPPAPAPRRVAPVRRRPASRAVRRTAPRAPKRVAPGRRLAVERRRAEPAPVPDEPPVRVAATRAGTAVPAVGRAGHRERAVDEVREAPAEPAAVAFALRAPAEADCSAAELLVGDDRRSRGASPAAFRVEPAVVLSEEIPATMVARIPDR